jgi:hypothetical protein
MEATVDQKFNFKVCTFDKKFGFFSFKQKRSGWIGPHPLRYS